MPCPGPRAVCKWNVFLLKQLYEQHSQLARGERQRNWHKTETRAKGIESSAGMFWHWPPTYRWLYTVLYLFKLLAPTEMIQLMLAEVSLSFMFPCALFQPQLHWLPVYTNQFVAYYYNNKGISALKCISMLISQLRWCWLAQSWTIYRQYAPQTWSCAR